MEGGKEGGRERKRKGGKEGERERERPMPIAFKAWAGSAQVPRGYRVQTLELSLTVLSGTIAHGREMDCK